MIVSLSELLLAIVLVPPAWVVLDWLADLLGRRRERRILRRGIRHCHLCGTRYAVERRIKLSQCPECAGRNEARPHRKLG